MALAPCFDELIAEFSEGQTFHEYNRSVQPNPQHPSNNHGREQRTGVKPISRLHDHIPETSVGPGIFCNYGADNAGPGRNLHSRDNVRDRCRQHKITIAMPPTGPQYEKQGLMLTPIALQSERGVYYNGKPTKYS